mgnify:FL=1
MDRFKKTYKTIKFCHTKNGDVMKNNTGYTILILILGLFLLTIPLNIQESRAKNTNYDLDSINKNSENNQDNSSTQNNDNNNNNDNNGTDQKSTEDNKNFSENANKANIEDKTTDKQNSTGQKYVALTFDDGPSGFTKEIVSLLKEYNYNATFFILGNKLNIDYKEILQESLKNGNEIGIHGFSHKSFTRLKMPELEDEINKSKKYVYNLTGYTPTLVRPPYGNINNDIRKSGYGPYILWNNDTLDWKLRDAKKIYNRLTTSIEENNIILMHDTYLTTYKALELILPYLKENNYKVVTVSKLFAINGKTLENTKSYRYAN